MSPGGGAGDLVITIGGDLSALEQALDQIPGLAQDAFAGIQSAAADVDWSSLNDGADAAATSLSDVSDAAGTATGDLETINQALTSTDDSMSSAAGSAGELSASVNELTSGSDEAQSSMDALSGSLSDVSQAQHDAAASSQEFTTALGSEGETATEAEGGFAGMAEQLVAFGEALAVTEALHEFGQEALTTYANVQKADISLTALTGSANAASEEIDTLEKLAVSDALSFPALTAAAQKMTALGFSSEQVKSALQAAADASAATGNDFATTANAIDRMVLSGTVAARQLATLGISTSDLGKALGDASLTGKDLTAAFQNLDNGGRIEAITSAMGKFQGVAQAAAGSLAGQWQNVGTQFEFVMEGIGKAIAPVITALLSFAQADIIPAIQAMVDWFNQLPGPIQATAVVIGLLAAAIPAVAVAVGGFGLALSGVSAAIPAIEGVGTAMMAFATESIPAAVAAVGNVVTAVSEGLVGALTAGETVLLAFAAAGAAVAAAFVFYDQIKQLVENISNLTTVLSEDVPWWNDLKSALSSVADTIGGAVTGAFNSLMGVLGPVGNTLKSIGAYLPSFSSLWKDVSDAIGSIHWSDMIGPIGALNSALKALADAIELVTGKYPSMQAASTSALGSIQSANDKLNDSLAKQAGAFNLSASAATQSAGSVAAHAAAVTTATTAVQAFVPPMQQAATATRAFVGPLQDAGTAAQAFVGPIQSSTTAIENWNGAAAGAKALGIEISNDAPALIDSFDGVSAVIDVATGSLEHWDNQLQQMVSDSAAAKDAVDSLVSSVESLGSSLDSSMSASIGKFSANLKPGDQYSSPTGHVSEGTLGDQSSYFMAPYAATSGETPFGSLTNTYDPSGVTQAAQVVSTASMGVANSLNTVTATTNAMTQALQQVADANAQEAAAAQAVGTPAYTEMKAAADAAVASAGTALAAAQGQTTATVSSTAAINASVAATTAATAATTTAASSLSGVLNSTGQAAYTAAMSLTVASEAAATAAASMAAIPVIGQPGTAYTPGTGTFGGVGGISNLIGAPNVPIIGGNPYTAGQTQTGLSLTVNAGNVVGAGGMQQFVSMIGQQLVQSLAQMGVRLNRQ